MAGVSHKGREGNSTTSSILTWSERKHTTGEAAWEALLTIHVVEMEVDTERKRGINGGSNRAREGLEALGITAVAPPQVPETD